MGKDIFNNIKVGYELPLLVKVVDRAHMVKYSATTWDFHPGHYDSNFARSQGFKDVYVDGPMSAAFMAQFITDWLRLGGTLKKMSITYRAMVFPGDILTCAGKVSNISTDRNISAEIQIDLSNQDKTIVATGKVMVEIG